MQLVPCLWVRQSKTFSRKQNIVALNLPEMSSVLCHAWMHTNESPIHSCSHAIHTIKSRCVHTGRCVQQTLPHWHRDVTWWHCDVHVLRCEASVTAPSQPPYQVHSTCHLLWGVMLWLLSTGDFCIILITVGFRRSDQRSQDDVGARGLTSSFLRFNFSLFCFLITFKIFI